MLLYATNTTVKYIHKKNFNSNYSICDVLQHSIIERKQKNILHQLLFMWLNNKLSALYNILHIGKCKYNHYWTKKVSESNNNFFLDQNSEFVVTHFFLILVKQPWFSFRHNLWNLNMRGFCHGFSNLIFGPKDTTVYTWTPYEQAETELRSFSFSQRYIFDWATEMEPPFFTYCKYTQVCQIVLACS